MADDYRKNDFPLEENVEDQHDDDDRNDYLEETAAETAPITGDWDRTDADLRVDGDDHAQADHGTGYGILALVLSILGFFFLPVVMGAAGIIIGFIARAKGAKAWGGWAIGVGIAAIVLSLFAAPFF